MDLIKNLIVGAGPAGLAIAARLRKADLDFTIWEASEQIAHSWTKHYKRLHLHTAKQFSHLPFKAFPDNYPVFVSRKQLVAYCKEYARAFDINPVYGKKLVKAKSDEGLWQVTDEHGNSTHVKNLIVATGLNRVPKMPSWPGMETFQGDIIHSRDYRDAAAYKDKVCLVVGMGNTGAEIALDLAEKGIDTSISVRSSLNIVPREAFGRPTQETALRLQILPRWAQDVLGNLMKRLTIGNLSKYGIETSHTPPLKQLRNTGRTPVIDLGTVKMIRKGKIKVRKNIGEFSAEGVAFTDGSSAKFDSIICATGYQSGIDGLVPELKPYLDAYGNPKFPIGSGPWSGLYFLGFDNFRPGGILGIIHEDSRLIANHIKHFRTPLSEMI